MRQLQRNPNHGTFSIPAGFKDLGWQLDPYKTPEKIACREAGHKIKEFDNSLYLHRGTDIITICEECKYVHHTDMSD